MSESHQRNKNILVFVEERTPRIEYTFDFVFRCVLGLNIEWIHDTELFESRKSAKINYSPASFSEPCLSLSPHPLLIEEGIRKRKNFSLDNSAEIPSIKLEEGHECPFATIFFFLSRYEEYWDFPEDVHGRFTQKMSLSKDAECTHLPIVDMWVEWIRLQLNGEFRLAIPKPKASFLSTFDIDHVRAFKWKGIPRSIGAMGKDIIDGNWKILFKRLSVWIGKEKDPYDVFDYLDRIHKGQNVNLLYFWLLGKYNEFDKNPNPRNTYFQKEIKRQSESHRVGIHPSYLSFLDDDSVSDEINILSRITGKSIFRSRFHFLRYRLPDSYQQLIRLGVEEDYSMGYPDGLGFRAGTSQPFLWYDLSKEETTTLSVHPFQIMDVTLKNYMRLSPNDALGISQEIIHQVEQYGGTFTILWHNSSFEETEWGEWIYVFEKLLEKGANLPPPPFPGQSA